MVTNEAWAALNAGQTITDGHVKIWYKDGILYTEPEINNPLFFENSDHAEDFYVLKEVEPEEPIEEQLYCRWYQEYNDGSIHIDEDIWYPIEKKPVGTMQRCNEGYTKAQLIGESTNQ